MNIKVYSTHFDITSAIDAYATKKISSIEKFLDVSEGTICEVELGKESNHHKSGEIYKAEVHLTQPGHKDIYVVARADDIYPAIDIVRDEIERAVVSQKKKHTTLLRRGASAIKRFLKRG